MKNTVQLNSTGRSGTVSLVSPRNGSGSSSLKTIALQGTLGSTSNVVEVSFDGGTTWIQAKDVNGNDITTTTPAMFNLDVVSTGLSNDGSNANTLLSVVVTGGTPNGQLIVSQDR